MHSHASPTAWIILAGYCAVVLLYIPFQVGLLSKTGRRATIISALCGLFGATVIVGVAVSLRGVHGLPPKQATLFLFTVSPATAALVGWLTSRVAGFFRQEAPLAATRKAAWFVFWIAVRAALLFVILNGVTIIAMVDLSAEIPEIIFLRLELVHYLYIGAAAVIVFVWIFKVTRRGQTSSTLLLAFLQVISVTVAVLLLLPILMAHLQVAWSTPILDCSRRGIPGYVPDMIDYARLVLDSLVAGALLGMRSYLGWQIATCTPVATSRFAWCLVYGLYLAPIVLPMLLVHRFIRLRNSRRTAP
jgi:hypothetical protein